MASHRTFVVLAIVALPALACNDLATAPSPASPVVVEATPSATPAANHAPKAVFLALDALTGPTPLTVRFDMCASTDPDPGDSLHYSYDFGEGSGPTTIDTCQVAHTFAAPGEYSVVACASDRPLSGGASAGSGQKYCQTFPVVAEGGGGLAKPPTYGHAIGYPHCPTGARRFLDSRPISATRGAQAKLACEACLGAGECVQVLTDCAGPAWGSATLEPDRPHWGYDAGCSGAAGRVWRLGDSTTEYGRWAE